MLGPTGVSQICGRPDSAPKRRLLGSGWRETPGGTIRGCPCGSARLLQAAQWSIVEQQAFLLA